MTPKEEELKEDEEFERQIEMARVRAVEWKGDVGYVPRPPKKPLSPIRQYRPKL